VKIVFFAAHTVKSIYEVPLLLEEQKISSALQRELQLKKVAPKMSDWKKMVHKILSDAKPIKIGMAGKYNGLEDAYLSVIESIQFAANAVGRKADIVWDRYRKN
jgi:CTP synthase